MIPARNRRIRELFDAAMAHPPEGQADFLWRECGEDEELVRAVWRLLGANRKSDGFLSEPAWKKKQVDPGFGAAGSAVGPYKIVRELGAGGMGVVYQAVRSDEVFHRVVALKVIRPDFVTDTLMTHFQNERRVLALLDHPNIARIMDGGATPGGLPYFVMDYVDGLPITKHCDGHQLSVPQRLALFRQVCAATVYLHGRRIVHGDFKPSNILISSTGMAKILDFGIARAPDEAMPAANPFPLMTPGYASPEQLRGEPAVFASDIYSLGVVLYELLSGSRPYKAESRSIQEVLTSITTVDPPAPSVAARTSGLGVKLPSILRLEKSLRGDLDAIVLKALRREPAGRYDSAAAFDQDIALYLEDRPVAARQGGLIYRAGKYAHRNWRALAALTIFVLLLSVIGWQSWQLHQSQEVRAEHEAWIKTHQNNEIADLVNALAEAPSGPGAGRPTPAAPEFGRLQMNDLREMQDGYSRRFPEAIHIWPGMTPLRRELLDQAHQYLELVSERMGDNDEVRRDLALAWLLVGGVEGNPNQANLKNYGAAAEDFRRAEQLLEAIIERNPNDEYAQQLLQKARSTSEAIRRARD